MYQVPESKYESSNLTSLPHKFTKVSWRLLARSEIFQAPSNVFFKPSIAPWIKLVGIWAAL